MRTDNLIGIDYEVAAQKFKRFDHGIIDAHSHIHGKNASELYRRVARLYGILTTYSMTRLEELLPVKEVLGSSLRLICMTKFGGENPLNDHGQGYVDRINKAHALGARIVKFWSAPRLLDFVPHPTFLDHPLRLTSPARMEGMHAAAELGMPFLVHIADPDTWFATKYKDKTRYGTKRQNHELFEQILERFKVPTVGAHMAGSPEDLEYLSSLLSRYPHLHLDISATKWIVRELSKHKKESVRAFFIKWKNRLLFGSDIVTQDAHLIQAAGKTGKETQASSEQEAFDLYASRYWALRTLLETDYDGPSPIADPDLNMVDPEKYTPHDSPRLQGLFLPDDVLRAVYFENSERLYEPLYS